MDASTDGMGKSKSSRKEQALLLSTMRDSLAASVDEKERISAELQLVQSKNVSMETEITQLKQRVSAVEIENQRHKMEKAEVVQFPFSFHTISRYTMSGGLCSLCFSMCSFRKRTI